MKSLQFTQANYPLELIDLPRPKPTTNQVLIEVKAAGLCHSDCFILKDPTYSFIRQRPIILGHEVAGIIVEIGPGVSGYTLGDRIVSAIPSHPIQSAEWDKAIGLGYDGGYAQYAIVLASNIVSIPAGISFAQAAVATDSIATAYHAVVTEGEVKESTKVAIIGLGGLGLAGVQVAAVKGGRVYGVDLDSGKFGLARRLGAVACEVGIDGFPGVFFDVIIDFAGAGETTSTACSHVRAGGKVVLVGLAKNETRLNTHDLVTRNITVQGSIGASKEELEEILDLVREERISPVVREIPFLDIPRGLELLERGEANGRLFADPSKYRP